MNHPYGPDQANQITGVDCLDDEQLRAINSTASVQLVTAGPGSGKTRLLTNKLAKRIRSNQVSANHCLAITFTRAASSELRTRLERMGLAELPHSGTIHSISLKLLKTYWKDSSSLELRLIDRTSALKRYLSSPSSPSLTEPLSIDDISLEIGWKNANQLTIDQYITKAEKSGRLEPSLVNQVAELINHYETQKKYRKVIDFDDLLIHCIAAFENDTKFAKRQQWIYRHVFLDEMQDLTPLQFRLIKNWAGEDIDLFCVGDPRQSIYSWSGADPLLFREFYKLSSNSQELFLSTNYRSSSRIVELSNHHQTSWLDGNHPQMKSASVDLGTHPQIAIAKDESQEIELLASIITREIYAGTPLGQIAVLTRTNKHLAKLKERLGALEKNLAQGTSILDAIELTSLHRSKGREWRCVILAGCEEGNIPFLGRADPDEEARLFYVGITRATKNLYMIATVERAAKTMEVSRYLYGITESHEMSIQIDTDDISQQASIESAEPPSSATTFTMEETEDLLREERLKKIRAMKASLRNPGQA